MGNKCLEFNRKKKRQNIYVNIEDTLKKSLVFFRPAKMIKVLPFHSLLEGDKADLLS